MKNLILILFGIVMISCGSDSSKSKNNSNSDDPSEEVPSEEEAAQTRTLALDSISDLPACGDTNAHQLVYIIDEEQFYTCKSANWETIELFEVPLQDNEWYDRQTGWIWQKGGNSHQSDLANCSGDSVYPSKDEIIAAIDAGLDGDGGIWVDDWPARTYIDQNADEQTEGGATKHHSVCVFK